MLKFHYLLLILLGIGWALVAVNTLLISFGLPSLRSELGISASKAGLMLSFLGWSMLIGTFILGRLADLIGRKPILLIAVVLFSLPIGLIAFAYSWIEIAILLFCGGLGASTYMAIGSTLPSKYSPRKIRGRLVALLESSWAFGSLLVAAFAFILILPFFGWRRLMAIAFFPLALLTFSAGSPHPRGWG